MQRSQAQALFYIITIAMLVAIVGGAIFPLFNRNLQGSTPVPTDIPIPTFPPPVTDLTTIAFGEYYFHPSGLFAVPVPRPPEWTTFEPNNTATRQSIAFRNDVSVIEVYIENTGIPVASIDDLNAQFTTSVLNGSWSRYSPVRETGRRIEGEGANARLLIDFELGFRRQTFLARHVAWTDGTWVYVVRVVMPENARDQLLYTLDGVINNLQVYRQIAGTTPLDWTSYFDPAARHVIRFPGTWIVTDSGAGRPASIQSPDGTQLRVESRPGSVPDEAAARALVQTLQPGATVLTVVPVTRGDNSGFSVSFNFTNVDGDTQTGLIVLLNGADGVVHIANLRLSTLGIDLNAMPADPVTAGISAQQVTAVQVMGTFWLLPTLNVPVPTPTPIPTALPTATIDPALLQLTAQATTTGTITAEVTGEATGEATPEATVESTAAVETTAEATPEATAEATVAP